MSVKPVIPRAIARRDVEEAVDYYLREAGPKIALRFIAELEFSYRAIAAHPAMGSSRYAHELSLPDLGSRHLRRFPCHVFYVEREDSIDVWRVLHAERDVPAWLQEPA